MITDKSSYSLFRSSIQKFKIQAQKKLKSHCKPMNFTIFKSIRYKIYLENKVRRFAILQQGYFCI